MPATVDSDAMGGSAGVKWRRRRRVLVVAVISRVVTCALMVLSELIWPDWLRHDDPTVARFSAPMGLRAFAQWDAARFLLIAQNGYSDEQSHAFQPALPFLLRFLAPAWGQGAGLILVGIAITNLTFVASALALFELGRCTGLDPGLAELAVVLFCVGPASVFHSSVYTESPFALCTFGGILLLRHGKRWASALVFAVGTCLRSNGVINAGFLMYDALPRCLSRKHGVRLGGLLVGTFSSAVVLLPYVAFEAYGYVKFCKADDSGRAEALPSWCKEWPPSLYGHVQKVYWGNGFMAFWQLKQLPQFIRAAPALILALVGAWAYFDHWRALGIRRLVVCAMTLEKKGNRAAAGGVFGFALLPHVVQTTLLAMFALFFMNVQVTARFLSAASPSFHWWVAYAAQQPHLKAKVHGYLVLDFAIGLLLHPNALPWT